MIEFNSPITEDLTPEDWNDQLNLKDLSLDDLMAIWKDMKNMEAFGKKVGGFLKEVVNGRIPDDEDEYIGRVWMVERNYRTRKGGLDKDLILEDMGQEWVDEHSREGTEYTELRLKPVS